MPQPKKKLIDCPVCSGKGKINAPRFEKDFQKVKIKAAKLLRKNGFSIREIMKLLNYKSTHSINLFLKK